MFNFGPLLENLLVNGNTKRKLENKYCSDIRQNVRKVFQFHLGIRYRILVTLQLITTISAGAIEGSIIIVVKCNVQFDYQRKNCGKQGKMLNQDYECKDL